MRIAAGCILIAAPIPEMEPVIGHIKSEHRMGRNYLAHAQSGATNAILAPSDKTSPSCSSG